jgi:tetratricopeptide (TPR) repeat protein
LRPKDISGCHKLQATCRRKEVVDMFETKTGSYDRVFIESIVEEVNEMMLERYREDETIPMLVVCCKDDLPSDNAIYVHVFKTQEIKTYIRKNEPTYNSVFCIAQTTDKPVTKTNPIEADLYFEKGVLFMKDKEYEKAIQEITKAIELKPELADAYIKRGISYAIVKERVNAIEDFQKYLNLKPNAENRSKLLNMIKTLKNKYEVKNN